MDHMNNGTKIVLLSKTELSELITQSVQLAVAQIKATEKVASEKLSRTAAAQILNISVSTLDRISSRQPDLLPKHRDGSGKPYFYKYDIERYMAYRGFEKNA